MRKFKKNKAVMAANGACLRAGYNYRRHRRNVPRPLHGRRGEASQGAYRRLTGNEAAALGLVAAAHGAGRPLVYASYPITPASEILHELSKYKEYGVRTLQTEDEIAACVRRHRGVVRRRDRGHRHERTGPVAEGRGLGLAVMTELPLVVFDVQRGGPSTGMPTKTEQTDLEHRHVRPARRVSAGGARGGDAGGLLPHGRRGGPPGDEVHDAGDGVVGQFPGQRRRAVADRRAGRAFPTCARRRCPPRPTSPPIGAIRRRLARPWVGAGHPGAGAPHRRAGKRGRFRDGQLQRARITSG